MSTDVFRLSRRALLLGISLMCLFGLAIGLCQVRGKRTVSETTIELPEARTDGDMSVEAAIAARRSRRDFSARPLTLKQVAQLAWCAQGITGARGRKRAAPSAGATYPLTVCFAVGVESVQALPPGVYRYMPKSHQFRQLVEDDVREAVARAALNQGFLAEAPVNVLIAADYARTARRYGDRARRYVHMEAGHVAENIYLQAETMGLCTVSVGAFDDAAMAQVFDLRENLSPLYLMPVGYGR